MTRCWLQSTESADWSRSLPCFTRGATTGGSDIIGRLLKVKFPYLSMGRLILFADIIVVTMAAIVFGHFNYALYALIALSICSVVLDKVLYGVDTAKVAYIISSRPEEVFERIDTELERVRPTLTVRAHIPAGQPGHSYSHQAAADCRTETDRPGRRSRVVCYYLGCP